MIDVGDEAVPRVIIGRCRMFICFERVTMSALPITI